MNYKQAKLRQISRKYLLTPSQVEDLYIRTLDDYQLLERACRLLAAGEEPEEVYIFIVVERK